MPDNPDDKTLTAGAVQVSFASVGCLSVDPFVAPVIFFCQRFFQQILQSGESVEGRAA
jgi:hypothetical protein